jgi:hypothetical protein
MACSVTFSPVVGRNRLVTTALSAGMPRDGSDDACRTRRAYCCLPSLESCTDVAARKDT